MTTPAAHKRIIKALTEMPSGKVFTASELAQKLNQQSRTIGRSLRGTDLVEYIPGALGKWRKL